jgi:peptide/nickel transport system permease protein
MGWLIGSLVVIEQVFAYPGLGRLIILSINAQDIPVVQIGILIIAVVYSIGNLCADILYSVMDPRIDYE